MMTGSSSDSDASVRAAGSEVFAALIRLLPLDGSMPDPPDMPASLCAQRHKHRDFLYQLMDGNKAHHYPLPVTVDAKLREYQQVCMWQFSLYVYLKYYQCVNGKV